METDFITADWIRKYCIDKIQSENIRWESDGRSDGYMSGSHVGYLRALNEELDFLDRIERIHPHSNRVADEIERRIGEMGINSKAHRVHPACDDLEAP